MRGSRFDQWRRSGNAKDLYAAERPQAGAALAFQCGEQSMFRATLLLVVLMLGVGQDVALLCSRCPNASAAACQHQDLTQSPRVTRNEDCSAVLVAIAVIREGDWRGASAPEGHHATGVARFRFVPAATGLPVRYESRHRLPLNSPPLTALRI
jgi:hypothetical protein